MAEWWRKYVGKVDNAGVFFPEENWLELVSENNFYLHTYRFHNPHPKAIICCLHGMYSESNESSHLAQRFFEEGFAVIAFDQEGHGKSGGPKGTILSLDTLANDTISFIVKAKLHYPQKTPVFLMGLSMGGTVSVLVSMRRPDCIDGMLLCAPSLAVNPEFEPFLQKLVRCLNFCCGCVRLTDIDSKLLCRNPESRNFFKENPYNYVGKINVKTAVAMIDGLEDLSSRFSQVCVPFILFQGNSDKIVDPRESKKFYEDCRSSDKEMVVYEEMYHDVYHEPEILDIIEKCVFWLNQRTCID